MADEEFLNAVADVRPLKAVRRATLRRAPPPAPVAIHSQRDEAAALFESINTPLSLADALDTGEALVYLRAGLSPQVLKRLQRGYWVVQAHLDLHGLNRWQAALAVVEFLREARRRHVRCLRIVHGKGLGSPNREPVLKSKLRHWLTLREEVLAYCQAPNHEGGSGAILVLLRAT